MHGLGGITVKEHLSVRGRLRKQIYCGKMLFFFLIIKEICILHLSDLYLGYQRALITGAREFGFSLSGKGSESWNTVIFVFIWTWFYRAAPPGL